MSPPRHSRSTLTDVQRAEAVRLYEAGELNGAQIARRCGVEKDVVYRYLKAAGAVKGRHVHEAVLKLNAEIDQRRKRCRQERWRETDRRIDQFIAGVGSVGQFVDALLRADREGRLAEFGRMLPRV